MANLFRRIYDWLLRLFWYAYLSFSTNSNARLSLPDALFDTRPTIHLCPRKSNVTGDDDKTQLLICHTIQGN